MPFNILLIIGFLFGMGFGYCIQRAGFCIAIGLWEAFAGRSKKIIKMFLVIFIITSIGFLVSGFLNPSLGQKPVGIVRGWGVFNLLSGILFGVGISLNGGCILGTLRRIGEGDMTFLVILLSFIPGMALVIKVINPLIDASYVPQKLILTDIIKTSELYITLILVAVATFAFILANRQRYSRSLTAN
jgi:hypothetical protein